MRRRQDVVRVGSELYHNTLRDWWDPVAGSMMMSPNVFVNINDGTRTRLGTFVEWEHRWNREWTTIAGLRNDVVWMNTGPVQGYNMMDYGADAAAFNARDRARTDVNLDGSALLRYEPNLLGSYELGFARKTRSPNLYERYAWSTNSMAMNMNGWFGDGNGYIGNVDLEPEKAHTVSFTAGWHDPAQKVWELKVTPYYSYVQDYIDVKKCATSGMGMMLTVNCNGSSAVANNFVYLKFINQDAQLYGVNIAGKLALWDDLSYGRGVFRGTFGYVRGHRTDGIDLYHIMPINAKLGARPYAGRLDQQRRTAPGRLEGFRQSGAQRTDDAVLRAAEHPHRLSMGVGARRSRDRQSVRQILLPAARRRRSGRLQQGLGAKRRGSGPFLQRQADGDVLSR